MALKPAQTPPEWVVLKDIAHGGEIAGQRRKKGDKFTAPEAAVRYAVLEGIVGPAKAATTAPAAAKTADAARSAS